MKQVPNLAWQAKKHYLWEENMLILGFLSLFAQARARCQMWQWTFVTCKDLIQQHDLFKIIIIVLNANPMSLDHILPHKCYPDSRFKYYWHLNFRHCDNKECAQPLRRCTVKMLPGGKKKKKKSDMNTTIVQTHTHPHTTYANGNPETKRA